MSHTILRVCALVVLLTVPLTGVSAAAQIQVRRVEAEPTAAWKAMDTLFLRPIGIATTAVGVVGFVGTLPVSLATNTAGEAANAFVGQPAEWTFQRKLGKPGREPDFFLP
jgi:hypothetical protein